jgi:hypothetical protein
MPKTAPQRRLVSWVAADVVRFEDGLLREHWDVLQQRPSHVWRPLPFVSGARHATLTPHRLETS